MADKMLPINLPTGPGAPQFEGSDMGFESAEEIGPALNMRDWVRDAVEAKGAKMVGGGFGLGQADIDIELEGHRYNLSIRAIKR